MRRIASRIILPGLIALAWSTFGWPSAAAEVDPRAVQARFADAWLRLEAGDTARAIESFQALRRDVPPGRHAALDRVGRMLDRLERPAGPPDLAPARAILSPMPWAEAEGRWGVVLHQGSADDAAERLDLIDRVVDTFYLSMAGRGIELDPPACKLVSAYLARQVDYVATLRKIEAAPFSNTQGYYHPTSRVVFGFDARSTPGQVRARRAVGNLQLGGSAGGLAEAEARRKKADDDWRLVDLGNLAHETVHQLVAASRLAPRGDDFPRWLHEGFSTQFEVVQGGHWLGVGAPNPDRIDELRRLEAPPKLAPLLRDEGLSHGLSRRPYAEAWSLVNFLRATRPDQFATYLELLGNPRAGVDESLDADRDASIRAFEAAFGPDLGAVEADWHRSLRKLK